jgi:hypothetical protein
MDVPKQFQEVRILFTDKRLVTVLKKMAGTFMTSVVIASIRCHKAPHECGKRSRAGAK